MCVPYATSIERRTTPESPACQLRWWGVNSSKRSALRVPIRKSRDQGSSKSDTSELVDSDQSDLIPSIAKHLNMEKPRDLFRGERPEAKVKQKGGFRARHSTSSEDEGNLTGRSRIDIPDFVSKQRPPIHFAPS